MVASGAKSVLTDGDGRPATLIARVIHDGAQRRQPANCYGYRQPAVGIGPGGRVLLFEA